MLEIATTDEGLRLAGEVDLDTVSQLTDALKPHVREGAEITLDLVGVRFIGSIGVQVLIRTLQSLGDEGRLVLANPSGSVRRLFEVMGLDRLDNVEVQT